MTKPWAAVAASPEFQALGSDQQEAARQQYFSQVVAPQVPSDQVDAARAQFDSATRSAAPPAAAPQGVIARAAAAVAGAASSMMHPGDVPTPLATETPMTPSAPAPQPAVQAIQSAAAGVVSAPAPAPSPESAAVGNPMGDTVVQDTPAPAPAPTAPPTSAEQKAAVIHDLRPADAVPNGPTWDQLTPDQKQAYMNPALPAEARPANDAALRYQPWEDQTPENPVEAAYHSALGTAAHSVAGEIKVAADLTGSRWLRDQASYYRAASSKILDRAMAGNEDSTTTKTLASVFGLVPLVAGAPAGITSMVSQAGFDGYQSARDAGDTPSEALGRGTALALANYVGLRVRVPGIADGLTKAVEGVPAGEALGAFAHALSTNVGGMAATTALTDLYDKFMPGGLRPDMTATDMVHDLADTIKDASLISMAVPGAPLVGRQLVDAAYRVRHGAANVDVAHAIDSASLPGGRTDATPEQPFALGDVHASIDDAAQKAGLTPKAAAALRDAVATLPPDQAAAFAARAFHRFEANGLTKRAGAPTMFNDALQDRTAPADQPAESPAAAPAAAPAGVPEPASPPAAPAAARGQVAAMAPAAAEEPGPASAAESDYSGLADAGAPLPPGYALFTPETGTKGIPRANMPQIPSESRGALVNFLEARGIAHTTQDVDPTTLKPTQAEYAPAKVQEAANRNAGRAILISSDGHVLDGHHQWLAAVRDGQPIRAIRLDAPIDHLLPLVAQLPTAHLADMAETNPGANGERAQSDVASPSDVAPATTDGRSDLGGGSRGDQRLGAAGATVAGERADAAAPDAGARPASPVGAGGQPDASLRLMGKPLAEHTDAGLRKIAGMKSASAKARQTATDELARRESVAGATRPPEDEARSFGDRVRAALEARGVNVKRGGRSFAGGEAGAREITLRDQPEGEFMAAHGNSADDVLAHEFAHTFWAGATALPNPRDPANVALRKDLRAASREFRPRVWEAAPAHAAKWNELLADGMAFWLKHPERRAEFPALDKLMRGYDAGDLLREFPDEVAKAAPAPTAPESAAAQPRGASHEEGQQGQGRQEGLLSKRTGTSGQAKHPATVAGSRLLALVSKNLDGLDPAWIAEFSHRQETARMAKDGRPVVQWKNPLIPGVGKLFRKGGTQDLEALAQMLEGHGYLEAGAVDRDSHVAGQQAQELVRAALNRAEPKTLEERQADEGAAREAEAADHYQAIDAAAAKEHAAEREAIMAESGVDRDLLESRPDDDIPWDAPATSEPHEVAAFLGLTPEEYEHELQGQVQDHVGGQPPRGVEADEHAPEGSGQAAPTGGAEAGREPEDGQAVRPDLELREQTAADLKTRADQEATAHAADAAEQKRLDEKVKADAERDAFTLTGSDRPADVAEAHGQKPLLSQTPSPFYSALERGLTGVSIKQGDAGAWRQVLKGLQNKGVKSEEIAWSGLDDWLNMQPGKVSKEQVLDFLRGNGVQVHETMRSEASTNTGREARINQALEGTGFRAEVDPIEDEATIYGADDEPVEFDELPRHIQSRLSEIDPDSEGLPTKFGQYTLPGGKNYHELLLTLPAKDTVTTKRVQAPAGWGDTEGGNVGIERHGDTGADFRGSHWDEPNVLAHVRFNDRTDADGKRVLFIEEIQSDWAQQGKKKGFAGEPASSDELRPAADKVREADGAMDAAKSLYRLRESAVTEAWDKLERMRKDPRTAPAEDEAQRTFIEKQASLAQDAKANLRRTSDALTAAMREQNVLAERGKGVPRAPFVGRTEAWVSLALKRMVKYAVDNGYDRVAFVNGDQSAERYDLSKQIDSIETSRRIDAATGESDGKGIVLNLPNYGGSLEFSVGPDGKVANVRRDMGQGIKAGTPLEDIIGKELAERVMEPQGQGTRTFEGDGLKVGGEGMRAFYDKIVPNVAKEVVRKLGGDGLKDVQVGVTDQSPDNFRRYTGPDRTLDDVKAMLVLAKRGGGDIHDNPLTGAREMFAINRTVNEADLKKVAALMERGEPFDRAIIDPDVSPGLAGLFGGKNEPLPESGRRQNLLPQTGFDITDKMRATAGEGLPLFRRGPSEGEGVDPAALRTEADRIQSTWKDAPPVHVVSDVSELPQHIQRALRSMGAEGKTRALLMPEEGGKGDVYLIANMLPDLPTAQFALFHEVLGHHGLRSVLGSDDAYYRTMYALRQANPKLAQEAEDWWRQHGQGAVEDRVRRGMSIPDALKEVRALSTEEALADRAGRGEAIRGWQKVMAKVQQFLRSIGLHGVADRLESMTEAETVALLARARAAVEEGNASVRTGEDGQPLASRVVREEGLPADATTVGGDVPVDRLKADADYPAAKAGNAEAAARLVERLTPESALAAARSLGPEVVYVYPHAEEATGRNAIPGMLAHRLASETGAAVDDDIVQSNRVLHTGANAMERLVSRARFEGDVKAGTRYVVVDDVSTMGSTLAELADHLRAGGGDVVGVATLADAGRAPTMAAPARQTAEIERRYGQALRDHLQVAPRALTGSEAGYLIGFRSADELRGRIAAAGQAQAERLRARALREEGDGADGASPLLSQHTDLEREALARAGIGPSPSFGARVKRAIGRALDAVRDTSELGASLRQGALDQFHGIDRAVRREVGNLPTEQDPYITARLANGGTSSVMRALLLHGQAKWADNGQHLEKIEGSEGLLDILRPLGDDLNDFFGWMVGNRAARLAKEGRENNFTPEQIAALQGLPGTPEKLAAFRKAALQYAAFKRSVLDLAQHAGLIDAETRPAWDQSDYIPFYRQVDEHSTFSATGRKGLAGQSSGIRTLKGGEQALNDPMENLLMNFSRLVDASLKNNALRKTVSTLKGKDIVEKVGYDMLSTAIPAEQIRKRLIDAGAPPGALDAMPQQVFDGIAKMWSLQAPSDKDVIRVMVDGKPQFYRVHDPLLLKALTSFVPFDFPGLGVARAVKRILTATVTSTPEFMMRNFIRDTVTTGIITHDKFNPVNSIKGIGDSFHERGGFEHMLFSGASFQSGNINAADPTGTAKAMRRALRARGMDASAADAFIGSVVDGGVRLWEMYRHMGEAVENANREAVFQAAIKGGRSPTAAAFEAKDLMDFSLRGSSPVYQLAADVLPFFNARVQGLYRLGRADPKRVAAYGALMSTLSVALALNNSGQSWYDELPDWDKDTYWHFRVNGQHFRVPKPFELGVAFGTLPERIARYMKGFDTGSKLAQRTWANVMDQLAFDPVPQIIRPTLDVYRNTDEFRGTPIENESDQGKLPTDRFDGRTSETVKQAVRIARPIADRVGASPKRVEHLIDGYFGTAGVYALGLTDLAVRALDGAPPQPTPRLDQWPIVKSFYQQEPTLGTVYETDLYALRQQVDQAYASVIAANKVGNLEEAERIRDAHPELAAKALLDHVAVAHGDFDVSLATLRKRATDVYNSKAMTPQAKREMLDKIQVQRNALTARVMTTPAIKALQ